MHLSGLFIYPVKSLRGFAVNSATVDPLGFVGDRRFLVVDESGKFLTQRTYPHMALVATALDATHLTLSTPDRNILRIPLASDPAAPLLTVSVWKSEGLLAEDCGETAAEFLSAFLGARVRLVRAGERFSRPILKPAAQPADRVMFADAVPFLVISEASFADLNARLDFPLPMDRFRANLIVTGCAAFAEDAWPRFRIGGVTFRAAGPCTRCTITTTDQLTGERSKEPLRTLATYRRAPAAPTDVNFGQNLIHETKSGTVRIGDAVELL